MDDSALERCVFEFSGPDHGKAWTSINDNVMGGVSQGRLRLTDHGTALFSGETSLENNGGFSSVRSGDGAYDLSAFGGIALRCRGDGRRYKLLLRTDTAFDVVVYQAAFDTIQEAWSEPFLPFRSFVPTHHGRKVEGAPALDTGRIRSFGLLIADGQAGPFRLEIEWMKARQG